METAPVVLETSVIPHDLQAEILAYLVKDKEVMVRFVNVLTPDNFENPVHRLIYGIAARHYAQYLAACTRQAMERELAQWVREHERELVVPAEYVWREVTRIYDMTLQTREYIVDKVQTYVVRARLAKLSETSSRLARQPRPDVAALTREVDGLYSAMSGMSVERMEYLFRDLEQRNRQEPAGNKIRTGLPTFDRVLGGGLERGELGVMLAPTGWGKSFFLSFVGGQAVLAQKRVVHVTLELSRRKVIARYESLYSKIPKRDLFSSVSQVNTRLLNLRRILSPLNVDLLVIEYPTRSLTVDELRSVLTQVKVADSFPPDLIILDYADILKPLPSERGEKRYEMLMVLYERLRGLAQEFDVPIWTGSQTSKRAMGRDVITIADIAESFGKAQVADVVAAMCMTASEREQNKGRFYIDKNRDNVSHVVIPFKKNFDICFFEEDGDAHGEHVSPSTVPFTDEGGHGQEDDIPF